MSFIEWWFMVTDRELPGAEKDAEEGVAPWPQMGEGGPYREIVDTETDSGLRAVFAEFDAGFRSLDGTDFTCRLVVWFSVADPALVSEAIRGRVAACMTDLLRTAASPCAAVDLLAVMPDFVRAVCLGIRVPPVKVLAATGGLKIHDVVVVWADVDSGSGRPFRIRFQKY